MLKSHQATITLEQQQKNTITLSLTHNPHTLPNHEFVGSLIEKKNREYIVVEGR